MIALGNDGRGYTLKQKIMEYLDKRGEAYVDFGSFDESPVDYPVYAGLAAEAVASGRCDRGILICGSGIGMSIAANRFRQIRAALCRSAADARITRLHNDANVLALGGDNLDEDAALEIVEAFLSTTFSNEERHVRRVKMLEDTEE